MAAAGPTPGDIVELFDAAPLGLGAIDRSCRWVHVNDALAQLYHRPAADLIGRRPAELLARLGPRFEAVVELVLETGIAEQHTFSGTLDHEPGVVRHWDIVWFPIETGVGVAAVEVTSRRAAEEALAEAHRRDALMARAGHLMSTALSLQETADLVARLVVPEVADWCFVELLQADGTIDRVSLAHRNPGKERWARELSTRFPLDPESSVGSPHVVRTGQPLLLPEITDEMLVQSATSDEHLAVLREVGFISGCIVPLVARGRIIGDLALATGPESGRRCGPDVLVLAHALADRCALALDNARLYAQRDMVAVSLQEELLPRELPEIPGLDVAARYSAAGEGNDVGGDFYDLFASGDGWQVVVGDVVGKGPAGAAVTGLARHTIRAAAPYEASPAALLRGLNEAILAEDPGRRMATVAIARLEPHEGGLDITVAAAGHPLPLLVGADGSVREVGAYGQLLGADRDLIVTDVEDRLEPGEVLLLYTDGVTDARGPGGVFGEDRLRAQLEGMAGEAPSRVVQRIEGAVLAASGGRPRDDLAMVALRLRPSSG